MGVINCMVKYESISLEAFSGSLLIIGLLYFVVFFTAEVYKHSVSKAYVDGATAPSVVGWEMY